MQQEMETAGTMGKRRRKTSMADRGMDSLLAAVEVASNHSPGPPDRVVDMTNASPALQEPRKGARVFTADERATLETEYAKNKYPSTNLMKTLATQFSKNPRKVITWFNNRRSRDRKMAVDVERPSVSRKPSSKPKTSGHSTPLAQTASNPQHAQPSQTSPLIAPTLRPVGAPTPSTSDVLAVSMQPVHANTPATLRWPSKTTPVQPSRQFSIVTPIPPSSTPARSPSFSRTHTPTNVSSSRVRPNPKKFRKVRLRLGQTELQGEGHPNEVGLEVKFLFKRKQLVYEWYCGKNYSDASGTGGPYARIEINFDSLFSMAFVRTRDGTVIQMTLSDSPALYRQKEPNIHKFKERIQQRQYELATPDQFKEDVHAKDHQILLRSDEAARLKKDILEHVPELACLLVNMSEPRVPTNSDGNVFRNDRVTDTESISGGARTELATRGNPDIKQELETRAPWNSTKTSIVCTPRLTKRPSEPSSSVRSDAPAIRPAPQTETSKNQQSVDMDPTKDSSNKTTDAVGATPMAAPSRAHVWETPTRSNVRRGGRSLNSSGINAPSGAAFLFPASGTWQSPATPFGSELTIRGASVNYWLAGGTNPLVDTMGSSTTPVLGPVVRRALDFTPGSRANTTPTAGRKRQFVEINDENDANMGNKQARQTPTTPLMRGSIFPPPPMPPPLPPPPPPPLPSSRIERVKEDAAKAKKDKANVGEKENETITTKTTTTPGGGSVARLPR